MKRSRTSSKWPTIIAGVGTLLVWAVLLFASYRNYFNQEEFFQLPSPVWQEGDSISAAGVTDWGDAEP